MKKFEEEFDKNVTSIALRQDGESVITVCDYNEAKAFGHGWVSPGDYQAEIEKIELQNLKYREEIERMQKSLRKKNKAIKELNGAIKKSKARLKAWHSDEEFQLLLRDRDTLKQGNDNLFKNHLELVEENDELKAKLEKQQPEIPEVPQFVADWYEKRKDHLEYHIWRYIRCWGEHEKDDFYNFMNGAHSNPIEILIGMKNGYTVAKDPRFYLKHELTGQFLAKRNQKSEHQKYFFWTGENPLTHSIGTAWELKFTQQEIDSMETGSYEQIPVEEKHG